MTSNIKRRLLSIEGRTIHRSWLKYAHRPVNEWPDPALNGYLGQQTDDQLRELFKALETAQHDAELIIASVRHTRHHREMALHEQPDEKT